MYNNATDGGVLLNVETIDICQCVNVRRSDCTVYVFMFMQKRDHLHVVEI